ncbi:hypothetical protein ACWDWT_25890 [Streptomyces sp. NPDC003343]|uniref:hypothetical protein n=1 Tax=Streptomyces sp. NPDC093269 TaxID=3366038 RepID=UPI00381CE73D
MPVAVSADLVQLRRFELVPAWVVSTGEGDPVQEQDGVDRLRAGQSQDGRADRARGDIDRDGGSIHRVATRPFGVAAKFFSRIPAEDVENAGRASTYL